MKQQFLLIAALVIIFLCYSCESTNKDQNKLGNNTAILVSTLQHLEVVNSYLKDANKTTVASISRVAEYKIQYLPLVHSSKSIASSTTALDKYIINLKHSVDKKGHLKKAMSPNQNSIPSIYDKNDQGEVEQLLLSQQGEVLYDRIIKLKAEYVKSVADLVSTRNIIGPIQGKVYYEEEKVYRQLPEKLLLLPDKTTNKETWLQSNFKDKTVEEVYVTLSHLQNKLHLSLGTLLNGLSDQMNKQEISYDKFEIIAQAPSTIKLGEAYTANILLGAYSSTAGFQFSVNDQQLSENKGKGLYETTPTSLGKKTYEAQIIMKNGITGVVETFRKTFTYEVTK